MADANNGKKSAPGYAAGAGLPTTGVGVSTTQQSPNGDQAPAQMSGAPRVGEEIDLTKVQGQKGGVKRYAVIALIVLAIVSAIALYFVLSGSSKKPVDVNVRDRSRTQASSNNTESDERLTSDAISRVRSQNSNQSTPNQAGQLQATPGAPPPITVQPASQGTTTQVGTTNVNATNSNAPVIPPADGVAGTVNASPATNSNTATSTNRSASTSSGQSTSARTESRRASRASTQRALVFGEEEERANESSRTDVDGESRSTRSGFAMGYADRRQTDTSLIVPVRPSFGSMLPVRTLVRMELTRDSSGQGWRLPRRTIIVGALRGSEFDRAYVSIVGYIDAASGRLVPFGGSLVGADAGEGIKGERRQLSSRWSRIFGQLADRGFGLAEAALGRRGGATIVLAQSGRPEINAVTREGDVRSFVAVRAGSMGYVSVTDLPREVEGVGALAEMSGGDLTQLLSSGSYTGTGLSDEEVAQLLSTGSSQQIRAALPRMTPEMRQIAEQVINQSGR